MFNEIEFKVQMIRMGITAKELAGRLNMDESTLYRKIKAGGSFSRSEINDIISILNIDDPKPIFFAEELA